MATEHERLGAAAAMRLARARRRASLGCDTVEPACQFIPLVSFPKSGNTYCRAILSRLLFGLQYHVIPDIHRENAESGPKFFLGDGRHLRLFKSHANSVDVMSGKPLPIRKVIWIRRHPLDVFLSYRHYLLLDQDRISDANLRSGTPFSKPYLRRRAHLSEEEDLANMLACFMVYGTLAPTFLAAGNWFDHSSFWLKYSNSNPCTAIRYEELVDDPLATLLPLAKELELNRDQLRSAIVLADDDTKADGLFFWKQKVNHYRDILPPSLIRKWYAVYGVEMKVFGY